MKRGGGELVWFEWGQQGAASFVISLINTVLNRGYARNRNYRTILLVNDFVV